MSMASTVKEFKYLPGESDQEYIKLLKEHLDNQRKITNKAVVKVKELSAKQQWIPCSEKLPEKEGRYLVTVNKGNEKCVEDDFFYFRYFTKDGTPSWYLGEDVVAWMPIPEPYKSEVEGRIDE